MLVKAMPSINPGAAMSQRQPQGQFSALTFSHRRIFKRHPREVAKVHPHTSEEGQSAVSDWPTRVTGVTTDAYNCPIWFTRIGPSLSSTNLIVFTS